MDLGRMARDAAAGAARGAAVGSVVPGVGTALGAATGAVLKLAPELGKWLFGPGAGDTIDAVRDAVEAATGTADPAGQVQAMADPAVESKLRLDLAQIAADRETARDVATQNRMDALLADVADARRQTVALAASGSRIAWGAPVVSLVATAGFLAAFAALVFAPVVQDAGRAAMVNIMVGALAGGYTGVLGYWLGSSAGSARKDSVIANSVSKDLLPKPAALVPAEDVPR